MHLQNACSHFLGTFLVTGALASIVREPLGLQWARVSGQKAV